MADSYEDIDPALKQLMGKEIVISVTQEHIDNGKRNPATCPIALAFNEQFGGGGQCRATVDVDSVAVFAHLRYIIYEMPADGARFVRQFDGKQYPPPSPFTLTLSPEMIYDEGKV